MKKLLAWPKTGTNPYNEILYREIEKQGIEVLSHRDNRLSGIINKIDIFHFHWLGSFLDHNYFKSFVATYSFIFYIKLLKLKKTQIIWTLHNSIRFTHSNKNKWLERILVPFLLKNVDQIIIHSKFQKNHIDEIYHNKIVWINHHNYCSILEYQSKQLNSEGILFFGSVSPYKGIEDAIVAYNSISSENIIKPFKIIGKSYSKEYEKEIRELIGNNKNIIFENRYVEDSELEQLVKNSKAIILPYKQITNSGSLIYSLSCNTQVIIKDSFLVDEFYSQFPKLKSVVSKYSLPQELSNLIKQLENKEDNAFIDYLTTTNIENTVKDYLKLFEGNSND